jgi:hypothetical protein
MAGLFRCITALPKSNNRNPEIALHAPDSRPDAGDKQGVIVANIDLTKVKKVKVAHDAHDANKLMEKGWAMIETAAGKDETGYPITRYSMAWMHDAPPQD